MTGNLNAEKRMGNVNRMIKETGFEPERVRLEWISASEGQRFADIIREFAGELRKMGPSPLKSP
jgi:F420-non-reducing hydrogenase iron-sulfur subunit